MDNGTVKTPSKSRRYSSRDRVRDGFSMKNCVDEKGLVGESIGLAHVEDAKGKAIEKNLIAATGGFKKY